MVENTAGSAEFHKNLQAGLRSITTVVREMEAALVEREQEILLSMVALVAKQHLFMLGPPGTGKTYVSRLIGSAVGGSFFEILLSKFTEPSDVFGPVSVGKLIQAEKYERNIEGYLPTAQVAMLDEALALDTPMLTPNGWTTLGELRVGDYVFGSDGTPTKILALTQVATDHECFRITFKDGESVVADGGHKWVMRNGATRSTWKTWTTAELYERIASTPSRRSFRAQAPLLSGPLVFSPGGSLPVDPYVMGLWLGNGNCWNAEVYLQNRAVDLALQRILTNHPSAYVRETKEEMTTISFAGTGLRSSLADLGLLGEDRSRYTGSHKRLLPIYLTGSVEDRIRLLQGLMDTDGYVCDNTCVFSNTNESLIDGVVDLVRGLGATATKRRTNDTRIGARGPHQTCWKVTFNAAGAFSPFYARNGLTKKTKYERTQLVKSIEPVPSVPVRCLTVDAKDHLFLAGRGLVVTHNCFKASSAILNSLLTIINERVFDNGGQRIPVPLQTLFSASNELPQDASLEALYDRFLLRHEVLPVTRPGELLKPRPKPTAKLVHLDVVQLAASAVGLPDLVVNRMLSLKAAALKEGIVIGDRRFQQSASLVRAAALLGGRTLDAGPQDLWPLAYCYWNTPDQIATMRRLVAEASQAAPTAPVAPPPTRPSRKPTQITHPTPQQAAAAASTASAPPGTPEQTFKALQTKMMGSISDIATNADIHTWIDQLLGGSWGSAQQRQQLADWKNACKKHARAQGTSWLGPNP